MKKKTTTKTIIVHGIDTAAVEAAVRSAERQTSGEIRVALARFYFWGDVRRAAESAFVRLGIDRTRAHNGVLIFVAPWRRRFAILGDAGIHQRVEAGFWDQLAQPLSAAFHAGDLTGGLVRAIAAIGDRLTAEFPGASPREDNQLPDSVAMPGSHERR
jgi:uncharacterized membrane protein